MFKHISLTPSDCLNCLTFDLISLNTITTKHRIAAHTEAELPAKSVVPPLAPLIFESKLRPYTIELISVL